MIVNVRTVMLANGDNSFSDHAVCLDTRIVGKLLCFKWLLNHIVLKVFELNQLRQNIFERIERRVVEHGLVL